MVAAPMEQTKPQNTQPAGSSTVEGSWRIIIRCYDTRVFTHDLARVIRLVTGRTRWEACQITAGIVAGHDEVCLIDGLHATQAERALRSLRTVGFMARRELVDEPDMMPVSVPNLGTVLRGFTRR